MTHDYKNILVRMPNWLGDLVMATPVLLDLKKAFPKAFITAMCTKSGGELLLNNPAVDEIFCYSRPNEFLRKQEKRDIIARLRQGKYDLGVLLPNSFSSAWWFWQGRVKERLGYKADFRSTLLTKKVSFPKQRGHEHLVFTYKRLLEPLGILQTPALPTLYVSEKEKREAQSLLSRYHLPKETTLIGINPGAAYGEAKCWPPNRFRELTEKLMKDPKNVVLYFGDKAGAGVVEQISRDLPQRVINLAGATTLRQLMALITQCELFLTNDSGPMHIAAALKTPLIALFGSTNDTVTGPFGHGTVIHKHVQCSPCYKRVCPIDFKCMKNITVEEVHRAILKALS